MGSWKKWESRTTRALAQTTVHLLDLAVTALAEAGKCNSIDNTRLCTPDAAATISQVINCANLEEQNPPLQPDAI
jgi:hypothetical protein